jgi:hypothetical protein
MPKLEAYEGGCHCGRVRFETTTSCSHLLQLLICASTACG